LGPFVDEGAGENGRHLGAVDGGHVVEGAGADGDAACFGEKCWDGVG
jgi:hypothetical protein